VVLAVAFRASVEVGVIATVAVFAHELPQEIADFATCCAAACRDVRA
jgi:zinc transporter ZupT